MFYRVEQSFLNQWYLIFNVLYNFFNHGQFLETVCGKKKHGFRWNKTAFLKKNIARCYTYPQIGVTLKSLYRQYTIQQIIYFILAHEI